jgi:hypothetical protein
LHTPTTWHHGLVADYWATVNLEAPELARCEKYLRSPVLDAGCGAGRLLAPLRGARIRCRWMRRVCRHVLARVKRQRDNRSDWL